MRTRRPFRTLLVLALCAGCVLWLPGCRSAPEEIWAPVSGTVKVEGKLLTTGWLTFHPDESRGNKGSHLAVAEIKPDGTYELSTNGRPAVPCGPYKVVVAASPDPIPVKPPRNPDGTPKKLRWLVHEKYTKPETTDARIEVVEKPAPGSYDLKLSR